MKCLVCESLSLLHICETCQIDFLKPSIYKRKLINNIEVISFYKYQNIKNFLHTKHTDLGYYIYKILAQNSLKLFAKEFNINFTSTVSIAIDDNIKSSYSHTAILNKALKSSSIKPLYNKLRATNDISYSGKSREFRIKNPRDFKLNSFKENNVILVDDIITTGITLTQAISTIKANKKEVLFCLTLADADL
jgi:competence protein ComFC